MRGIQNWVHWNFDGGMKYGWRFCRSRLSVDFDWLVYSCQLCPYEQKREINSSLSLRDN